MSTTFLAIVGYLALALILFLLISGKAHPLVVFTVIPVMVGVICGFTPSEISDFVGQGMTSVVSSLVLFMFSIAFFSLMHDVGLFEPIIKKLTPKNKSNVFLVLLSTLFITFIAHLDGSGTTTFIIALSACLPMTDQLKIRRTTVMCLLCFAMTGMNLVPWGGPTQYASISSGTDINTLFRMVIPAMILMIGIAIAMAWILSKLEVKHGASAPKDFVESDVVIAVQDESSGVNKKWVLNAVVTLAVLILLFSGIMSTYLCFMIGICIAFMINFPTVKEQNAKIKEYAGAIIGMLITIAAVGVYLGIMSKGGIIEAMAATITSLIPEFLLPHAHWVIAIFGCLFQMALGTSSYYNVLLPMVISVVDPFGVPASAVASAFLISGTFGSLLCPSVAALYVGLGLCDLNIGEHLKFSMKFLVPASVLVLIISTLMGVTVF